VRNDAVVHDSKQAPERGFSLQPTPMLGVGSSFTLYPYQFNEFARPEGKTVLSGLLVFEREHFNKTTSSSNLARSSDRCVRLEEWCWNSDEFWQGGAPVERVAIIWNRIT
jgi:hypothetical protein